VPLVSARVARYHGLGDLPRTLHERGVFLKFTGKYVDHTICGGGRGEAHKYSQETWQRWSAELSKNLPMPITLHRGTLNVEFADLSELRPMIKDRINWGNPVLECATIEQGHGRNPYRFYQVTLFQDKLQDEGRRAFLWVSDHQWKNRDRGKIVAQGRLDFASETINAKLCDPITIDFTTALKQTTDPA
jgi:hypothetical protein